MRTARSLTISRSILQGGVPAWGCTCLGGVPAWGLYLPGGYPAQVVPPLWTDLTHATENKHWKYTRYWKYYLALTSLRAVIKLDGQVIQQ